MTTPQIKSINKNISVEYCSVTIPPVIPPKPPKPKPDPLPPNDSPFVLVEAIDKITIPPYPIPYNSPDNLFNGQPVTPYIDCSVSGLEFWWNANDEWYPYSPIYKVPLLFCKLAEVPAGSACAKIYCVLDDGTKMETLYGGLKTVANKQTMNTLETFGNQLERLGLVDFKQPDGQAKLDEYISRIRYYTLEYGSTDKRGGFFKAGEGGRFYVALPSNGKTYYRVAGTSVHINLDRAT